jgi:ABC-2 type transport system permease protein
MSEAALTAVQTQDADRPAARSSGPLAHIWTIAKREMAASFESPIAYVFIVIFLLLAGFFTFMVAGFFERGEASLEPFFLWHPWLYLFLVPAIGMRMWSEERRLGTMELLLTMPITPWQAIVGKFLASWLVLGLALILTFPVVITVNYLGNPDNGVIVTGYIGSFLLAGAYLSIAAMTSALTRNQVISFILAVVICLFLVLVGYSPVTNLLVQWANPWLVQAISSFSVMTHFESIRKGVLDSRDILYFLSVIGFSLFTTSVILRSHRAG